MRLWSVVGGRDLGGIRVRTGRELSSPEEPERLSTGAVVWQLELQGPRLLYAKVQGEGPERGWVSVIISGKQLLVAKQQDLKIDGRLKVRPAPSLKGPLLSLERLLMHPGSAAPRPGARQFRQVYVIGAHHTCTNALVREIEFYFNATVRNKRYNDSPTHWKHRVFREQPRLMADEFCICLVKEPAFWIQSLARGPREDPSTFYEIDPLQVGAEGVRIVAPRTAQQLFEPVYFRDAPKKYDTSGEGYSYQDAIALWEACVRCYFDEEIFPLAQTAVVRCEDFQFKFPAVMDALQRRGLQPRPGAPPRELSRSTAKDMTHANCTRAALPELRQRYGDPKNRYLDLTESQVQRLQGIDAGILEPLRYGEKAVESWLR